jgi:membrane protease subunit HflK
MTPIESKGIILPTNGPWGGRPSDDGNGGERPQPNKGPSSGNGGDMPPDIDAFLREAQQKFKNTFGFGGNASSAGEGLGLLLAALATIWLATGFYRVQPSENAVVLTFGKWTETKTDPGLSWHIPWPVQEVTKIDVALNRRIVVGFSDDTEPPRNTQNNSAAGDLPFESLMLTGDENIININFVVLWRISDAGKYLFKIKDPETTIKKVSESAMREIIGRTEIQKALTEGRSNVESRTKDLMQKVLDEYQAGVIVTSVQLQKVNPPAPVVDAFDDVQRSRSDKERLKNEAETYTNGIVPRARGDAQKKLQDAEAYKLAVISKAQGDAQRFLSVYSAYKDSKDVTEKRIYLETMQELLQNSKQIIVGDGGAPVLPYLPLNQAIPTNTEKK